MKQHCRILCAALVALLCLVMTAAALAEDYPLGPVDGAPSDYSDADNWIALPEADKLVDTFYIYPTAYMPADADAPVYCEIDDADMRAVARMYFATQGTAFAGATNVFAPYYRQTSVTALEECDGEQAAEVLSRVPRTDLYAALDYYFENLNDGRPFILAGHSQGSMMTRIILKDYMAAHPDYYERMAAAYAIGYSITQEDIDDHPWLKFAEGADDTGVIVSWNTEGPGNGDSRLVLPGAISINPLNWKRDDTYASAEENLGSLIDGEIVTPGVADAQVDTGRGVVVCTNTDFPYIDTSAIASSQVFGEKSFHGNDYAFYYENIRQNVADRVAAYLAKQNGEPVPTDYALAENWHQIPGIIKDVDTFYIYPTVYINAAEGAPDYAPLGDPMMLAGVANVHRLQASVFEESTNLFIPYYRQANLTIEIDAFNEYGDIQPSLTDLPELDINAALDYYFEHYNQGRPFIIAGHSQGSAMTRLVLKHYFKEHPEYYERMVAAYVIGYSVTQTDLDENPHLKFARGADDTGVIVSWNTEGPGNKDASNVARVDGGISINPLNWKLDDTYASAEENLGSRVLNPETGAVEYMDIGADAQVDAERGVVITHADYPFINVTVHEGIPDVFGPESFHNGDYTFFYDNIRQNVAARIAAFMAK